MNKELNFEIKRDDVMAEVMKATEYTGAKMKGDDGAHERISTTEENIDILERYWRDAQAEVGRRMRELLTTSKETEDHKYVLDLEVSVMFDDALKESMDRSLMSFFVLWVTAGWYSIANKEEAAEATALAVSKLEDFKQKAYHKKRVGIPAYYKNLNP